MRTLIAALALLSACAPPMPGDGEPGQAGAAGAAGERGPAGAPGKDAVTAGSRLKPLRWTGSDGSSFAGGAFFDTERRERCFLQAVPGAAPESMDRICAPLNFNPADAGRYVRFSME